MRSGIKPGGYCFRSRSIGVVDVWKDFCCENGTLSSLGTAGFMNSSCIHHQSSRKEPTTSGRYFIGYSAALIEIQIASWWQGGLVGSQRTASGLSAMLSARRPRLGAAWDLVWCWLCLWPFLPMPRCGGENALGREIMMTDRQNSSIESYLVVRHPTMRGMNKLQCRPLLSIPPQKTDESQGMLCIVLVFPDVTLPLCRLLTWPRMLLSWVLLFRGTRCRGLLPLGYTSTPI